MSIWDQVVVDRRDKTFPYLQIVNTLRHRIATNQLRPGTVLPSVRELAKRTGVTPATVSRAYIALQQEGLIEGQVGVGTVVGDTQRFLTDARRRTVGELDAAIDSALTPLLQLGYAPSEITEATERRLSRSVEAQAAVVVSDSPAVLEKYFGIMRRELEPLGVHVSGVLLHEASHATATACDALRHAERVLTSLGLLRQVRAALERCHANPPISVIFTELSLSTIEQVSAIRPDATTLLVAEERYRSSIHGMLRQHLSPDKIEVLHDLDESALRAAVATCEVVVHSLGQTELVRSTVDASHQTILMNYEVRRDAMAKLRDSFAQRGAIVPA